MDGRMLGTGKSSITLWNRHSPLINRYESDQVPSSMFPTRRPGLPLPRSAEKCTSIFFLHFPTQISHPSNPLHVLFSPMQSSKMQTKSPVTMPDRHRSHTQAPGDTSTSPIAPAILCSYMHACLHAPSLPRKEAENNTPSQSLPRLQISYSPAYIHNDSFPLAFPPATQSSEGWKCAAAGTAVIPSPPSCASCSPSAA